MAEPERRRRRVRPPSGANHVPEEPAEPAEAAAPVEPPAPVPTPPPAPPVPAPPPVPVPGPTPGHGPVPGPSTPGPAPASKTFARPAKRPAPAGGGNAEDREAERGLRGLVGSGSSQVSVGAALRARDAARPTEEDLAAADRDLVIVRRNWLPREDLPRR